MRSSVKSLLLSLLLAGLLCEVAGAASAGASKPSAKAPDQRVQSAVAAIRGASSMAEVTSAIRNAGLTDKEAQALGDALEKAGLVSKLDRIRADTVAKAEAQKEKPQPTSAQLLKQRREALAKERSASLKSTSDQVKRMKPVKSTVAAQARPRPSLTLSSTQVAAARSDGESGQIGECPDLVIGREVTVRGEGFGSSEGRVAVLDRRDLYYCPVRTWTDTRVVFTVTDELAPLVGYHLEGVDVDLWLKRAGGETGPMADARVVPDPATLTPSIDSVTPSQISPGESFIIRGGNLVLRAGERPRILFRLPNGDTIRPDAEEYAVDYIVSKMPENVDRLQQTVCRLEVTNDVDLSASTDVTFEPAVEIVPIFTRTGLNAECLLPAPAWLCVFGQSKRYTLHNITLKNGWVVDSSTLDVRKRGIRGGAFYVEQPTPGATLAKSVIEVWCDAYSRAHCEETLFIRGPKGVEYR